ncbi:hypothetical protein [Actinomadura rubrisoli]|uniref:Uncharacterized protein n=1 Tax=Actinomadura rubrisoli TaxID=2530368 RepID=A0A4R4ZUR0_9ACTN|nr:hypothetical protein [Actinomadura rubrisoli]TDD61729.1 hypothetical protein E1298_45130 [Actinomadura rubrisoli]
MDGAKRVFWGRRIAVMLWGAGLVMLLAGFIFGVYPNPWGHDGHDRLTCGSAFGADGYGDTHRGCAERRERMQLYAITLLVAGAGATVSGVVLARRL